MRLPQWEVETWPAACWYLMADCRPGPVLAMLNGAVTLRDSIRQIAIRLLN